MLVGIIYKITAVSGDRVGLVYVGRHNKPTITKRFTRHCYGCDNTFVDRYIQKYGKESVKCEVIEYIKGFSEKNLNWRLNQREIHWISKLDCVKPKGFNLTYGGKGNVASEETKEKLRANVLGNKNPMFGKVNPMLGRRHSQESIQRMVDKLRGTRTGSKNPNYGKKTPLEVREKISKTLRGRTI
jgi:group I intron endonuclease